jgi:hypothetical protein
MGPLLQWETDAIQWNANLLFERVFRGHADEPRVTEVGYQFQARYGWRPELDFGVQAFGEMGKWNHWEPSSEQKHTIGPAIFGKVKLAGREAIKYDAAWLLGASKAAPDNAVRVRVEYEF